MLTKQTVGAKIKAARDRPLRLLLIIAALKVGYRFFRLFRRTPTP
jgi:hypothetical protein